LRPGSLLKIGLVLLKASLAMTSDSRRLAILTASEIHDLYGLPCFTEQERCIYFDLSPAEHDAVKAVIMPAISPWPDAGEDLKEEGSI
jgi:hypothetical protein